MTWLRAAIVRAIRTGAQVAAASLTAAAVLSEVEWDEVSGVVILAMALSMLTSLAGLPETAEPSPAQKIITRNGE